MQQRTVRLIFCLVKLNSLHRIILEVSCCGELKLFFGLSISSHIIEKFVTLYFQPGWLQRDPGEYQQAWYLYSIVIEDRFVTLVVLAVVGDK